MKLLPAILLSVLLTGCTGVDSPLQRDLQQLAELPKKMDGLVRRDTAPEPVPEPAPAPLTAGAGQAPVGEGALGEVQDLVPQVETQQAAAPAPVEPLKTATQTRAPTFLERLRQATSRTAPVEQGQAQAPPPQPVQEQALMPPADTQTATAEPTPPPPAPPPAPKPTLLERLRQATAPSQPVQQAEAPPPTPPMETAGTQPQPQPSPPLQQIASAEPTRPQSAPQSVPPSPPQPTLLERIRQATARKQAPAQPVEPPGAYDQIPEPIPVENPLARPPWEVFMEAGPNAHKELDLETLYGPGQVPEELLAEEQQAQEQQQATLGGQQDLAAPPPDLPAAESQAPAEEPPAKKDKKPGVAIGAVAVPSVKGARGSGNVELTEAMRSALTQAGWPVLEAGRNDALTIQGRVKFGAVHGASQSVQIVWDVLTPDGKSLGNLKQDNAIPAGSLDQAWGENAQFAAEAAAEGIFKLIQKYR